MIGEGAASATFSMAEGRRFPGNVIGSTERMEGQDRQSSVLGDGYRTLRRGRDSTVGLGNSNVVGEESKRRAQTIPAEPSRLVG